MPAAASARGKSRTRAPDGYTLLMGSVGTFGTQPLLYKLDYDPHKAFVPVATTVTDKIIMVAGPTLQVKSVRNWCNSPRPIRGN